MLSLPDKGGFTSGGIGRDRDRIFPSLYTASDLTKHVDKLCADMQLSAIHTTLRWETRIHGITCILTNHTNTHDYSNLDYFAKPKSCDSCLTLINCQQHFCSHFDRKYWHYFHMIIESHSISLSFITNSPKCLELVTHSSGGVGESDSQQVHPSDDSF